VRVRVRVRDWFIRKYLAVREYPNVVMLSNASIYQSIDFFSLRPGGISV
jgi:hypothetical protein